MKNILGGIMPGAIIHLLITEKIINRLNSKVTINDSLFYAGSIAPDAIHAKANYVREDKKRSHLRMGIRDSDFHNKNNLELFYKRVGEFKSKHINFSNSQVDFYIGYLIHLITDELFIRTIRLDYIKEMNKNGIIKEDKYFFKAFIEDVDKIDNQLLENFDDIERVQAYLSDVEELEVDSILTKNQIKVSREWILQRKFVNDYNIEKTNFITKNMATDFIKYATDEIVKRLEYLYKEINFNFK